MSRSWEVIGQNPTAPVSWFWELGTLGQPRLEKEEYCEKAGPA